MKNPVHYKSFGWPGHSCLFDVCQPAQQGKNLPAIIVSAWRVRWGRGQVWGYNSLAANFFANRGYAVLQPNFRASTGYGKKVFSMRGNLSSGGDKMQDRPYMGRGNILVAEHIADPKHIGILGGSYGGYATALRALLFYRRMFMPLPVSIVGGPSKPYYPALTSIPPLLGGRSEKLFFYKRMGDPKTRQRERHS